jgi:hypothetical protein
MASPDAAEEAFHLWNAVESPDRQGDSGGEGTSAPPTAPAAIPVNVEPPNVIIPSAPVPTLTRNPPARIQVTSVAYCDTHGWTAVVQVPVVLCSRPLDESTPPATGVVPASPAREPVEVHMDTPRASSPVASHRRSRSPSSPPSPPPRSAPRVNGPATAAERPLANDHATGTLAARRGCPRYASSPETSATPSSSRHCRP